MKRGFVVFLVFILLFAVGLVNAEESQEVKLVYPDEELNLFVGKTATLKPKVENFSEKATYTYKSNNDAIATVSTKGLVKGISPGTAIVTTVAVTEMGQYEASTAIIVMKPISSIAVGKAITIAIGTTYALNPVIKPEDATEQKLVWTSSKENVATVNVNGVIAAQAKGTAVISAASTDGSKKKATIQVAVKEFDAVIRSMEGVNIGYTTGSGMFGMDWKSKKGLVEDSGSYDDVVHLIPLKPGVDTFVIQVTNYLTRATTTYSNSIYIAPDALDFENDAAVFEAKKDMFINWPESVYELAYQRDNQNFSFFILVDTDTKEVLMCSRAGVDIGKYKDDFAKDVEVTFKKKGLNFSLLFDEESTATNPILRAASGDTEVQMIYVDVLLAEKALKEHGYNKYASY